MARFQPQLSSSENYENQFERPIYPTNAFRFLSISQAPGPPDLGSKRHDAQDTSTTLPESFSDPSWQQPQVQARVLLDIVIIGAGLGGLATAIALTLSGHKIRIYEQAPAFGEVGAGIQVPPNSTRYLLGWGVGRHIEPHISEPHGINIRRYQDGSLIGLTQLQPHFKAKYGAPYWVLHRADYHSALLARALELGVQIEGDREVIGYSFSDNSGSNKSGSVTITFKHSITTVADLVIAADGVKSFARTTVLASHSHLDIAPNLTSQAAYRCTVPLSVIADNPITSWISDTPNQNLWVGHGCHAMTYPIGGTDSPDRLFNLVLSHPEARAPEEWSRHIEETKAEMRDNFKAFEPRFTEVVRILSEHEGAKVVKWPIMTLAPLPTWIHASDRLVLIGDAAHAMVPYMSQGAAVAVEDAAAIATALSLTTSAKELPEALRVFESVRMERCKSMQQASWLNGEIWHLSDGEVQTRRDEAMSEEWTSKNGWNSNQWSDPTCQAWTYGYDTVEEVKTAWKKRGEK